MAHNVALLFQTLHPLIVDAFERHAIPMRQKDGTQGDKVCSGNEPQHELWPPYSVDQGLAAERTMGK